MRQVSSTTSDTSKRLTRKNKTTRHFFQEFSFELQRGPSLPKLFSSAANPDLPVPSNSPVPNNNIRFAATTSAAPTQSSGEPSRRAIPNARRQTVRRPPNIENEYRVFMEYYRQTEIGFECNDAKCKKRFTSSARLFSHLINKHKRRRMPKIPIRTPAISSFQNRLLKQISERTCLICSENCQSIPQTQAHIQNRHGIKIANCTFPSCPKKFIFGANRTRHVNTVHRPTN